MSFIPEQSQGFFGRLASSVHRTIVPPRDPTEAVRGWTKQLRVEARNVDKSIRGVHITYALFVQFYCLYFCCPHRREHVTLHLSRIISGCCA
jgi:hypothetical protein